MKCPLQLKLILLLLLLLSSQMNRAQGVNLLSHGDRYDSLSKSQTKESIGNEAVYTIKSIHQDSNELNPYVRIFKETNIKLKPEDLMLPEWEASFKPFHADSINCSTCIYWGKIVVKNETGSMLNHWILYLGIASKIDVYIFNQMDSLVSFQRTGRMVVAAQKNLKNGNRLERIALDIPAYEQRTIFFRTENINGYLAKPNLKLSAEDYYQTEKFNHQEILDGLFIGFLLAIIIFNLIFFFTTRDIAFFYQFLFVASVLVFMIDIMDLICDVPFLRDHPQLLEPINFASIVLLNISYLQFVNKFIQLEKVFPNWIHIIKKLVQINLILGTITIIYYFISLNERITDTAISTVSAIQYFALLFLLFQLLRIKDQKTYFILIATFFLIAGVIVNGISVALGTGVPVNFSKFVVLGNVSFFFFGLAFRMKLLKEEEHKAIRLKENQESKNRLYANITHEFRTPLTVIQGMANQIETTLKVQESSKLHQAIQLIKSNGNRLLKLVNTILDLAKLESGKMDLNLSHGDIIGFLRYNIQLFETYAGSKKIYLQFLTDLDKLEMDFDKEKIQQVVSNLISNAIKFTPQGGKIYFSVKKLEKNRIPFLQMEVKDTGEGIPPSELGNIFNRFFQVEGATQKSQGSGLGLALVQELVKLMQGQIQVESEVGKGTVFNILIPVTAGTVNSKEKTIGVNEKIEPFREMAAMRSEELMEGDNKLIKTYAKAQKPGLTGMFENGKPLLLIVDDNKDINYYLQTLLEHEYTIETAFNGQDGISLAQEMIPDIIISDVLMPDKDGYELCTILKNDVRTSHIPVILLTAKVDSSSRIEGLKSGADAYLIKPFDELELKVQLENLLNIRKSLQDHYKNLENKFDSNESAKPIEDAFLIKLNAIIQDKIEDEDFGILQLCRSMQMSRTQLHRKITALTGRSTSIYIRSLRLEKAKQLLKRPEMNISEVAFSVGFSDPNYFTRTFMEEFGITPSLFKSQN